MSIMTETNPCGIRVGIDLATRVPTAKIFFNCHLLPGVLKGEDEYLVIGGVYDIAMSTL